MTGATVVPLSPHQLRLWQSGAYHVVRAPLAGDVDPARLRAALRRVAERHDGLRTRVREAGGLAYQEITPWYGAEQSHDPANGDGDGAPDPAGPPLRAAVTTAPDGGRTLELRADAAVLDPRSLHLIVADLRAALTGAPLPSPGLSWADAAAEAATARLFGPAANTVSGPASGPAARVPPVRTGGEPMEPVPLALPAAVVAAAEARWRLADFLAATAGTLVARMAAADEALIGMAARTGPDVVGMAETVTPLRLPATASTDDCCARAATARSAPSGEDGAGCPVLVRWRDDRDTGPVAALGPATPEGAGAGPYDLVFDCRRGAGGELAGWLSYDPARCSPSYARLIAARWAVLAARAAEDPARPADRLDLLGTQEAALLGGFAGRDGRPGEHRRLHELILDTADRVPGAVAVTDRHGALSYGELAGRARSLAGRLRALGAGPDTVVAVCADRSNALAAALLGVMAADAAYLPLDPQSPPARLAAMAADAGAGLVLADEHYRGLLAGTGALVLDLDGGPLDGPVIPRPAPPRTRVTPDDLAYVIFTSGSTGRPKAVAATHRGIVNRLLWMRDRYELTGADVVLQKTPLTFDVSVWELFLPLLAGARLVMAAPGEHRDAAAVAALIRREGVTVTHFVPSMLALFADEPEAARCTGLRHIVCSGEALPVPLANRIRRTVPAGLHNLYGPTEASVDVTHWTCLPVETGPSVPIGRPIAHTVTVVLDRHGRLAPIGTAGELHLGGVGLARGYLGRPALTAERFVPDPLGVTGDGRLYRTGDLARWTPDGVLEYLGRTDHQLKLHGVRIEPGEIEAVLREDPSAGECVVIARTDLGAAPVLVAYVTGAADPGELRRGLRERLPSALVPSYVVPLERLPVTANGKLDRAALPAPER